jgi:hypothetical protein
MLGKSKSRRQTADGFRFSLHLQLVNKFKKRKYYFEENVNKMPVYVETSKEMRLYIVGDFLTNS